MKTNSSATSTVPSRSVASLAYQYYLDEGRPEGRDQEHWFRAEKALSAEAQRAAKDVNGVPEAEMSRFVGEGGSVKPVVPKNTEPRAATRERIREHSSATAHAPRQSSRPPERSCQTR